MGSGCMPADLERRPRGSFCFDGIWSCYVVLGSRGMARTKNGVVLFGVLTCILWKCPWRRSLQVCADVAGACHGSYYRVRLDAHYALHKVEGHSGDTSWNRDAETFTVGSSATNTDAYEVRLVFLNFHTTCIQLSE